MTPYQYFYVILRPKLMDIQVKYKSYNIPLGFKSHRSGGEGRKGNGSGKHVGKGEERGRREVEGEKGSKTYEKEIKQKTSLFVNFTTTQSDRHIDITY